MTLTVGILSFAHPHVHGYAAALAGQGVRVIGTDTGTPDPGTIRGADLAAQLGITYAEDVASLLAEAPDAVVICSENSRHRELTEQALAAGAHVLCEKPLATSDEDAAAMVAAAERAGRILMTAYPVRFAPTFADLVARCRAGQLGQILAVVGTNNGKMPRPGERSWFTDPARSGGGALMDHVVHVADLLDELLGEPAENVHAVTNQILHAGTGVETGGVVSVAYPSGVIAQIDCSWSVPDSAPTWGGLTLEVHGTRGSMRIDPFAGHVAGYDAEGAVWQPYGPDLDARMIATFLDAVRTGTRPQPDGGVGARTLAIVTAAQRSVASGRPEPTHLH
ncbi:Gfo/Idh/MocA family oxidoreductase [Ruania alkalisoli]|uniref:Gfo/Idh/MocA family oxidoreductase n=1 Tax=Ruania alkalisoli TaxID=2779775 RepID=A0A7M1SSX1_9MICO|nr:Gfo/Idh/MocA family oxidoreductase [Ruania alkalisoli]QOR70659.1 Gfo/Idh/MocA family oxidoreductase [Ruania alkalisoli]